MEIAIVGTGRVAERNYIPSLLRHEEVSLTCYSRTQERAQAVGMKFGVRVAQSLEDLFERQPQTVFVLTGEQQRLQIVQDLLAFKPKRLFLEKPLVARDGQARVSPEDFWDGKRLLEQAQETGTEVAMVFNFRFFDQTKLARRLIQERAFGLPINVIALSHYATWSHCIDLILQFAGPVHTISAQSGKQTHMHSYTDTASDVTASFLSGDQATGTIIGTNGINWRFPLFELMLNFEGGRIHLRGLDQSMEVLDYNRNVHETFSPSRETSRWHKYEQSFEKVIDAYLASIRKDLPPPVPGIAGLLELQFEAGLKESIAKRRPVNLAKEFPIEPVR